MSTSNSRRKPEDLKGEGKSFKGVCSFKYLGNMINNDNRDDNCFFPAMIKSSVIFARIDIIAQ
jgi:hypothetical protein